MDRITENLLTEFSEEHEIANLSESKKFEHFAAFLMVSELVSNSFDTADIVVGDDKTKGSGTDTGIDGIAILVNDKLVSDLDEFVEIAEESASLNVEFVFVQAETSPSFEASKIGNFAFGVKDFFNDVPQLPRNAMVTRAAQIKEQIYTRSRKFKGNGNGNCHCNFNGNYTIQRQWQLHDSTTMATARFNDNCSYCLAMQHLPQMQMKVVALES